jgi:hypothetical protein
VRAERKKGKKGKKEDVSSHDCVPSLRSPETVFFSLSWRAVIVCTAMLASSSLSCLDDCVNRPERQTRRGEKRERKAFFDTSSTGIG